MEVSEDEPDNENDDTHNEDIPLQALPKEFLEIFRRYLECPSLCNVVLRFHHQVVGEENGIWGDERHDRTFRLNAIKMLVSSLLSAPQLPRELSIQDLHNVHDTNPVVVGMIARVLGGLQSLRLNVRNEHFEANTELDYEVFSVGCIQNN